MIDRFYRHKLRRSHMKSASTALEHKPGACLGILLAVALLTVLTACGNGPSSPASGPQQGGGPIITSVVPNSGPVTGGTVVKLLGSGFETGAGVNFGSMAAASVTVVGSSQIRAVTPSSTAGTVSITVTNPDSKSGTLPAAFAFFHTVTLSWTASTAMVAGYQIYRSLTHGGPYTRVSRGLVTGTTFTDNNVQPGETLFYVSTAVGNNGGESNYSNESRATVPSP
jgi:IPT/TIG domain